MTEKTQYFHEGDEIVIVSSNHYNTSYTIGKIAKVYKTGKFILENSPFKQQWRDAFSKNPIKTGVQGYNINYERVAQLDDAMKKEIADHKKQRKLNRRFVLSQKVIERQPKIVITYEIAAAAEHLANLLKGNSK